MRKSDAEAKRYIVAAAIWHKGIVCSVPRPGRHHNVIREMARAGVPIPITGEQGFLTSDGLFVSRRLAMGIAEDAGQLIRDTRGSDQLFSEDVW